MKRFVAVFFGRLVVLSLAIGILIPSEEAASVTAASGPPVVLAGHVLSRLARSTRVGDLPQDQTLTLTIGLRPRTSDAIEKTLQRVRSTSPAAYLSPDDVALTIGQPRSTVDTLSQYFRGYGMSVVPPSRDYLSFQVTGTNAQIRQALGVHLGTFRDSSGNEFYATSDDPQLPSGLASSVQAIFGLDNYPALRRLNVRNTTPSPGSYVPADLRTAYNVNPLLGAGLNGSGQTIGILGCDNFFGSDILAFQNAYGLPTTAPTTVQVDGGGNGSNAEATLDLEWSQAIAPNVALRYYLSPGSTGCTLKGVFDGLTTAVNDHASVSIISISLGLCEADYQNSGYLSQMETEFAVAASVGQGVFVASGDAGAYSCLDNNNVYDVLGVSYPASSAYVTAVGGTTLHLNQDGTANSETAWGYTCGSGQNCEGSGGGVSGSIPEPSWQSGSILSPPSTGGWRGVPDISLDSDPATGYTIYYTDVGLGCSSGAPCTGWGGTSIASPQWAALAAIANQYAGRRLGQLAPLLYSPTILGAHRSVCYAYHDVTAGNSGDPRFYPATANWDFATGWGSPNATNLVHALGGARSQLSSDVMSGPNPSLGNRFSPQSVRQVFLPIVINASAIC